MDDPEAAMMRVLYDEHATALWRYALRLTGDRARAEDVVQETLLRAWRHPSVIADVERPARAWLFTVARNMIIDERRSARFRHETDVPDPGSVADSASPDDRGANWTKPMAARNRKATPIIARMNRTPSRKGSPSRSRKIEKTTAVPVRTMMKAIRRAMVLGRAL